MDITRSPRAALTVNRYCSTCLMTRRFLDQPGHLECEACRKRLVKVEPGLGVKR